MKKYIVLLIFISAVLASCDEPRGNFSKTTFNRERQLWLEQDMQNYSFRIEETGYGSNGFSGGGPSWAVMYIKDGVLSYIWVDRGYGVLIPENEEYPLTGEVYDGKFVSRFFAESITQLYEVIERRVNDAGWRDTIEIHYDSEWHYPSYFRYGFAEGGYLKITVSKFVADAEIPE